MPRSKRNHYLGYDTPFATKLRKLIDAAKIPQNTLADYIGITRQAVSAYTLGVTLPDIEKFELIADYFQVSTEYLLGRTEIKKADATKQAAAEYLSLSEEAIDQIIRLKLGIMEQMPLNDYKISIIKEPLPDVFSAWLESVELPKLMNNIYRMLIAANQYTTNANNPEAYLITHEEKEALLTLQNKGYIALSFSEQNIFFTQLAISEFRKSLDRLINEASYTESDSENA
jgi:transcriptional regulator with XRE-family HTH domain